MGNSHKQIFSSETTGTIATKLWWNGPWMTPFQNCVRSSRLPTKMAAKLKIENRGDEIKKKSSPLKLLSQSQPNFAEMILGWSPSNIVSSISNLWPRWPPQPNLICLFHYLYLPASTFCNVLGSSSAFAWIQISRLNNPSVISLKIQASFYNYFGVY